MHSEHYRLANHAVIAPCHAICLRPDGDIRHDAAWELLHYQRDCHEPDLYTEHFANAIKAAADDLGALLIFSGGQTRPAAGPKSEAQSYYEVAERALRWLGRPSVRQRATTEEFAADSFQNLLFGIARFREVVGNYPGRVTIISWRFKRARFDMHRAAIRFPQERFTFIGPNDPNNLRSAEAGEAKVVEAFQEDPYGVGPALSAKRIERNPFRRQHGYSASCPELCGLLSYQGRTQYDGCLPW